MYMYLCVSISIMYICICIYVYGVATMSRLLKITGLFCRISSLLQGSFAKETYNFKEPANCRRAVAQRNCCKRSDVGMCGSEKK